MEKKLLIFVMVLLALGMNVTAQNKQKSTSGLTKRYVKYAKEKAKGNEQLAQKKSSDPATVTREKKDSTDKPKTFKDVYEDFKKKARSDYENFRDEANKKYADFVRLAWESYQIMPAIPQPKEEEVPPVVMPEEDKDKPINNNPLPIEDELVTLPDYEPQPVPIAPIKEKPIPQEKYVVFKVYGTEMQVRFNDDERFTLSSCDKEHIADMWEKLSDLPYNNTIRDCIELRIRYQLSDWAYLNMLDEMSKMCLGEGNEATLLMAYVYCQSGYSMRMGISDNRLYLLYASQHTIYGYGYFVLDNTRFYIFHGNTPKMQICEAGFPNEKPMSLMLPQILMLANDMTSKRTLVSKRYPDVTVNVSVNRNLIDFYNEYPSSEVNGNFMTRWAMYANTPLDLTVRESLYPPLKSMIEGMGQKEAMERLLNFVQTAFVYEYDDKVWGCDRAFFAEETLYYPYCDCEDRSIFLSRIVRDLLGLKVILIYYPGHLAMAVGFTEDVNGDYILLNGIRYVVCDPTYIGAPVGRTMPDMDNKSAKVILLE